MWELPRMTVDNILMYLRKSRTDDPALTVEEVLSKHEQMLCDWVERNFPGQVIPGHNRYREVVSGETIDSRPKVLELLRRVESPRIKAVLVVEPQRLSRGDLEDIGRLVKLLRYSGTIVITLKYAYDLSDDRDRDDFERELKRGNEFLEYQKRIMGNGRQLAVENGCFIGQTPPFGYRKVVLRDGKRKIHTLEPDPETAPIVRMIFQMYADGANTNQIARSLRAMGARTARGSEWTISGIKPILTNDHYIGMVHWNRRKTVKIVEDGEVVATRPRSHDYLSYPGRHPAIIDRELWDVVQAIHGTHLPVKERAKLVNPFAGILFCRCGSRMSYRQYKRNGVDRSAPRLLCENQLECGTASCRVEEMSAEVIRALEQAIADFDLKLEQTQEDTAAEQQRIISRLEKRLDDLDKQELSQWDKYTQEAMPKHIFDKLHQKLLRDRAAAQRELEEARQNVSPKTDYLRKRQTFANALASLRDSNASVKEQNQLLKQCIRTISYHRAPKDSKNRRFGTPEPLELTIDFII